MTEKTDAEKQEFMRLIEDYGEFSPDDLAGIVGRVFTKWKMARVFEIENQDVNDSVKLLRCIRYLVDKFEAIGKIAEQSSEQNLARTMNAILAEQESPDV